MGRGQNININRSLEEVNYNLHRWLWRVQYFKSKKERKKKTEDVVDISRELELEMKSEDMTDLLQSYYKTLIDEELLLMDERRKWFLEMESTLGEDAMKSF